MIDTQPRTSDVAPLSEPSTNGSGNATGTVTSLVSGILEDAQKLVRQQFEMLKAEVLEDIQKSKRAAEFGGLGVVLLTVGMLGLVTALAYFMHEQFQLSLWISWTITGGVFVILGTALAATSYFLLERFNPLPHKTLHALEETFKWKTK
jgi:uncharacterized membrane protein YqjE